MSDVICISSSDGESETSKKYSKNTNKNEKIEEVCQNSRKRKLSLSLSKEKVESKRCKTDNQSLNSDCIQSSGSDKGFPKQKKEKDKDSKNHSEDNSCNKSLLSKPGSSKQNSAVENRSTNKTSVNKLEREELPCASGSHKQSNSIRKVIRPQLVVKEKVPIPDPSENIFAKFLEVCKQKNNDETTEQILSKLQGRYDQLKPVDIDNEEFRLFLNGSIQKILHGYNNKFYSYIREVQSEIKRRIKKPKTPISKESKENNSYDSNPEMNANNIKEFEEEQGLELSADDMRKVRKLEKAIKKCQKKIKLLESIEVNFDDEEDSAYLQEDRYKRKLVELCNLYSKMVGDTRLKQKIYKKKLKLKDIPEGLTRIISVDEAIIDFVNLGIKKINQLKHISSPTSIADYLTVPDYPDILQCISKCNIKKDLNLSKKRMETLAQTAFKALGRHLKHQRIHESEEYISSYIEEHNEGDPALKNSELKATLQKNKKEGDKKLEEIFKKYVDKQEGLSPEDLECQEQNSVSEGESENELIEKCENNDKQQGLEKIKVTSHEEKGVIETNKVHQERKKVERNEVEKDEEDKVMQKQKSMIVEKDEISTIRNDKEILQDKDNLSVNKEIKNKDNLVRLENKILENNDDNEPSFVASKPTKELKIVANENIKIVPKINIINIETVEIVQHDEIEILSDDEKNMNKKSNDSLDQNRKDKEQDIIQGNSDRDPLEESASNLEEVNLNSITDNVLKENNDNVNLISILKENCSLLEGGNEILNKSSDNPSKSDSHTSQNIISTKEHISNEHRTCSSSKIDAEPNCIADEIPKRLNEIIKHSSPATQIKKISQSIVKDDEIKSGNKAEKSLESKDTGENKLKKDDQYLEIIEISELNDTTDNSQTNAEKNKGTDITTKSKTNDSLGNNKSVTEESFIKVCSFAKPPDSWKDSLSPEKNKQNIRSPLERVPQDSRNPECVDLTAEKPEPPASTSTRILNPLAINKRRTSVQSVVLVKNVVNNYNVSLPADAVTQARNQVRSTKNLQAISRNATRTLQPLSQRIPSIHLNQIPANNFRKHPTTITTNIRSPFSVQMQNKDRRFNNPSIKK